MIFCSLKWKGEEEKPTKIKEKRELPWQETEDGLIIEGIIDSIVICRAYPPERPTQPNFYISVNKMSPGRRIPVKVQIFIPKEYLPPELQGKIKRIVEVDNPEMPGEFKIETKT